jgi:hypothetical protein
LFANEVTRLHSNNKKNLNNSKKNKLDHLFFLTSSIPKRMPQLCLDMHVDVF